MIVASIALAPDSVAFVRVGFRFTPAAHRRGGEDGDLSVTFPRGWLWYPERSVTAAATRSGNRGEHGTIYDARGLPRVATYLGWRQRSCSAQLIEPVAELVARAHRGSPVPWLLLNSLETEQARRLLEEET